MFSYTMIPYLLKSFFEVISCDNCQEDSVRAYVRLFITLSESIAQMLATHDYKKNPESPVGNELDVNEGDTLVYLMTNENNEHCCLAEDGKGQVGYVPAAYLNIIRDVTRQEEESDTARKEGYGKKTDGTKIGGRYDRMEKEEIRIQRQ